MEANKVLPDLQALILCEDVRQELNGLQTLVGVINILGIHHVEVILDGELIIRYPLPVGRV